MSGPVANNVFRSSGVIASAAGGLNWQAVVTASTLTAEAGNGYLINTTSNTCTITLPASAEAGDKIIFVDYARTWGTYKIIIDSNGLNYQGEDDTYTVEYDTDGQTVSIVYSGATVGWIPEDDDAVEAAIAKAQSSLEELKTALTDENRYTTATKTLNVSSLMAGGVDAIGDLEAGRGVDPETFAALYAGQAADEIAAEIDKDEKGRLTYKGKVVRLYSITRLKQVYQARIKYAGESDDQPLAF